MQVQQYHTSVINECIAAAALVWHDCLLTKNDEHLFTGAGWVCVWEREAWVCSERLPVIPI